MYRKREKDTQKQRGEYNVLTGNSIAERGRDRETEKEREESIIYLQGIQ
jgi:hypothetical protein